MVRTARSLSSTTLIKPVDLGFDPEQYPDFRLGQLDTINSLVNSDAKLTVLSAPTGSGKSMIGLGMAQIVAGRGTAVNIVTHQKALQEQYMSYRLRIPTALAKGRNNFYCQLQGYETTTVDKALCVHEPDACDLHLMKVPGDPHSIPCQFFRQRDIAVANPIRILNYPLVFLDAKRFGTGVIVCDEGHRIDKEITGAAEVELTHHDIKTLDRYGFKVRRPRKLLFSDNAELRSTLVQAAGVFWLLTREDPKPLLNNKLQTIKEISDLTVAVTNTERGVLFSPLLPEELADRFIGNYRRVILMSATIFGASYWARRLNIDNYEYLEMPSTFPAERRPVHVLDTAYLGANAPESEWNRVFAQTDAIISKHLPGKGVIHAASYDLTDTIMERSRYKALMIRGDSDAAIERFKQADLGILVSPRVTEGVDLPGELCEFVVFPKVPYKRLDEVTRLRESLMPGSYAHDTMATIIQGFGRGMRSADDSCHGYILDRNFRRLWGETYGLLPGWFKEAVRM